MLESKTWLFVERVLQVAETAIKPVWLKEGNEGEEIWEDVRGPTDYGL